MKKSIGEKITEAIDTGGEKINIFSLPFVAFFFNFLIPGSGFKILGRGEAGLINFLIAVFIYTPILLLLLIEPLLAGHFLHIYIFVGFFSGCAAFGEARNINRKKIKFSELEKKQRKVQTFLSVCANIYSPGTGILMLGQYWKGILNIIIYYGCLFFWVVLLSEFYLKKNFSGGIKLDEILTFEYLNENIGYIIIFFLIANTLCGRIAYMLARQINEEDKIIILPELTKELDDAFSEVFA